MVEVITNKQLKFLEQLESGEITKEDNPKRYSEMMIAIQKQIDRAITNTLWLTEHRLDLIKDEVREIEDPELERYRRFKAFAYILTRLDPMTEMASINLPEILNKLSMLYPKYYFKIMRKDVEGGET